MTNLEYNGTKNHIPRDSVIKAGEAIALRLSEIRAFSESGWRLVDTVSIELEDVVIVTDTFERPKDSFERPKPW